MKRFKILLFLVSLLLLCSCSEEQDLELLEINSIEESKTKLSSSPKNNPDQRAFNWCSVTSHENHYYHQSSLWKKGVVPIAWTFDYFPSCNPNVPCPPIPLSYDVEFQIGVYDFQGNVSWGTLYTLSWFHVSNEPNDVVYDIPKGDIGGSIPGASRFRVKRTCESVWTDWIVSN